MDGIGSLVKLLESQVQEAHVAGFDVSTQRARNHRYVQHGAAG